MPGHHLRPSKISPLIITAVFFMILQDLCFLSLAMNLSNLNKICWPGITPVIFFKHHAVPHCLELAKPYKTLTGSHLKNSSVEHHVKRKCALSCCQRHCLRPPGISNQVVNTLHGVKVEKKILLSHSILFFFGGGEGACLCFLEWTAELPVFWHNCSIFSREVCCIHVLCILASF